MFPCSLPNLCMIEEKVTGMTPQWSHRLFVSQGQGDQVQVGSFAAKAGKCHRPHHSVSREGREEAGEAAEVSDSERDEATPPMWPENLC